MALAAFLLGYTLDISLGMYNTDALLGLSAAAAACVAAIALPRIRAVERVPAWIWISAVALGVAWEATLIVARHQSYPMVRTGTIVIAALGLLQAFAFDLKRVRQPLVLLTVAAFALLLSMTVRRYAREPPIDVFVFQQMSSDALLHGRNPYTVRYPSVYPPGTPFYGPGVVAADNRLDYGFPYFPLSLLLVVPGYVAGDSRFAHAAAIAMTAGLMASARPGRWAGLIAMLFLLTPPVFFIVEQSWTEPLMAFTLSLTMFAALRWRRALPYALGLLFATKQYTVLMVPLVWLLVDEPRTWRRFAALVATAGGVALAITLPFFLWDPRAFYRAVVAFQFLQPFRLDALSYLVWIHHQYPQLSIERWAPFVSVVPATALALWRCPRTPAGFAAAVAVVYLTFFAFNKQAFANYYYFVIAAACWSAAAQRPQSEQRAQSM